MTPADLPQVATVTEDLEPCPRCGERGHECDTPAPPLHLLTGASLAADLARIPPAQLAAMVEEVAHNAAGARNYATALGVAGAAMALSRIYERQVLDAEIAKVQMHAASAADFAVLVEWAGIAP